MRQLKYFLLTVVLFLSFGLTANAQTREQFLEIEDGFWISKAIESDGTRALLIKFPEKYLVTKEAYAEGTRRVLVQIFSCEVFPQCPPKSNGEGTDKNGKSFVYVETVEQKARILIRGLADKDGKVVGAVFQLADENNVVYRTTPAPIIK